MSAAPVPETEMNYMRPGVVRPVPITSAMLRAGRAAFKRQRAVLDDLYDFYPCDLNEFLTQIYREMARAAEIP